jgi:hypothetical protein
MKVIYILFEDIGDGNNNFLAAYADIPDKSEIEKMSFQTITSEDYKSLYSGYVLDTFCGGFLELRQYTLKS